MLARISGEELEHLFLGYGYRPYLVEGSEPEAAHQAMAATLDAALQDIHTIQSKARATGDATRPRWPMIILRTPKGWTGPKEVDGKRTEGSWRSHQVPLADMQTKPDHVRQLEQWMRSYRAEELFDEAGALVPELAGPGPQGKPAHERQPSRQRRGPAAGSFPAGLPGLRGQRAVARHRDRRRRRAPWAASSGT